MTLERFVDLADVTDTQLKALLGVARRLEAEPRNQWLAGRVLGLLFLNPSLRTLSSMQAGMAQLGGSSFVLTPGQGTWALETRTGVVMDEGPAEHCREAVPVLQEYCDVLGVRCFARGSSFADDWTEPVLSAFTDVARKPVVNLESAVNHPCQALADHKTLDDLGVPTDGRFVLTWAWHPKALPLAVPAAVAAMAARRGMEVIVHRPEGFGLPAPLLDKIRSEGRRSGGTVVETTERDAAMDGAHVVYAKSWRAPEAYGEPTRDAAMRSGLRGWCVDESWFRAARAEAPFLHCLPVRRNVVVADAVLDGPRSQVIKQAGNRLHVQKALLATLLGAA